jgi:hypothetical protein
MKGLAEHVQRAETAYSTPSDAPPWQEKLGHDRSAYYGAD